MSPASDVIDFPSQERNAILALRDAASESEGFAR